jgi:Tol biopolymer transport system component
MGIGINTDGWEMAPSLTPDGKYLLYTWRKSILTNEPSRIYWVSTKILEKYRHIKK